MKQLFADTNIFGIVVDARDKRRKSVWITLDKVAGGVLELNTAEIVVEEIKETPIRQQEKKNWLW
jgi:predicted nucleic acid-binding protein